MQDIFMIDGHRYNVKIIGLTREGTVVDGENAGRTLDFVMHRDVRGTFYNYSIEIATDKLSLTEYDQLYETITAPVPSHTVTLPYGQGTKTWQMYITTVNDVLLKRTNRNFWGNLSFNFVAMSPARYPL